MWGQLETCPDLSFPVSLLTQFQANPGIEHWSALMPIIEYIKNTLGYGLTYSWDAELSPCTYVDTDYGDAGTLAGLPLGMFLLWLAD